MKATKIQIENYKQFNNITLDFTYPKGHEKEGQPLEKVCFIGQSGTGKTTLLHLIKKLSYNDDKFNKNSNLIIPSTSKLILHVDYNGFSWRRYLGLSEAEKNGAKFSKESLETVKSITESIKHHLIYYPADLYKKANQLENTDPIKNIYSNEIKSLCNVINFAIQDARDLWEHITKDIEDYQEEEIKLRLQISEIAQKTEVSPDEIIAATTRLKEWKKTKFNPIQDLADNCLDKILNQFGLRVKTKLDFKQKEDIGFIKVETLQGEEVPMHLVSTGTRQIILTALPLYALKPKNTIILFDEPERSLYPNLQTQIIDLYTNMAEHSQFFFATHSPIIASCFEPWEIVELQFNQDNYVEQRLYYKGERHIDNYFIDPRVLRWDSLLDKVFGVEEEGNSEFRTPKLMELAAIKSQLKKMKNQDNIDKEKQKELWATYKKLAELLDWKIND